MVIQRRRRRMHARAMMIVLFGILIGQPADDSHTGRRP